MQLIDAREFNWRATLAALYLALRYYVAFTLLTYGFAKVMGAQFTVLDSQLAKPMGEVSGFWLTWYYFGYSTVYSNIIAFTQIGGALLLCFRRTAALGALILLPVMVNIACVDIWVIQWNFHIEALRNAIYVLLAICGILSFHAADFYRAVCSRRHDWALLGKDYGWLLSLQIIAILGMLAYTAHEGYWLANFNNRAPTAIDGAWYASRIEPANAALPDWIYFEYNRAHLAVFHFPDGRYVSHDFRVDAKNHELTISQQWLIPGSDIFKGTWKRQGDTMRLNGSWGNGQYSCMVMKRKPMPVRDHK